MTVLSPSHRARPKDGSLLHDALLEKAGAAKAPANGAGLDCNNLFAKLMHYIEVTNGQVFWLPDPPTDCAFPPRRQWQ